MWSKQFAGNKGIGVEVLECGQPNDWCVAVTCRCQGPRLVSALP